jgi:catechol 2,3-dioxygenase-like lactoylglutathione lyase family enzyme
MQFHRGRMVDHVHIVVADLDASRRFYQAALGAMGLTLSPSSPHAFFVDELYVSKVTDGQTISHIHLAFQAADHEMVAAFHKAAIAAGGRDNGAPGERRYHPGYYAAFVLDPDGNNIEAVFHGPNERSADAVVITAL